MRRIERKNESVPFPSFALFNKPKNNQVKRKSKNRNRDSYPRFSIGPNLSRSYTKSPTTNKVIHPPNQPKLQQQDSQTLFPPFNKTQSQKINYRENYKNKEYFIFYAKKEIQPSGKPSNSPKPPHVTKNLTQKKGQIILSFCLLGATRYALYSTTPATTLLSWRAAAASTTTRTGAKLRR